MKLNLRFPYFIVYQSPTHAADDPPGCDYEWGISSTRNEKEAVEMTRKLLKGGGVLRDVYKVRLIDFNTFKLIWSCRMDGPVKRERL